MVQGPGGCTTTREKGRPADCTKRSAEGLAARGMTHAPKEVGEKHGKSSEWEKAKRQGPNTPAEAVQCVWQTGGGLGGWCAPPHKVNHEAS